MTVITNVGCCWMRTRFTRGCGSVMATETGSYHLAVIQRRYK